MHELAPIIHDLAVILGVAGFVTLLFQKIHQPVVLGYLVAGMIVGPYTPPHAFVTDVPNIKVIAELGVIFLMFSLGLEFSFHKLTRVGFSASVTGIFEVVLMMILGLVTGQILGWSYYESLFLGAALSISSTTIIIKALEELSLTTRRFADVIFGILVVEDLLAILILVALSTVIATKNIFSFAMLWATAKLVTVVTAWFLVGFFIVPNLFRNIARYANSEILTIVSIALCLMLVVTAAHFHYSTALGAFIMGSILAETPQMPRIKELIRPIRDIFAAVFFVSVGMLIDPKMILAHASIVLFISAITISGKIVASGIGAFITGQSFTNSLRIGFSMAQIGEFSFIIVGLGITLGVIDDKLYAIVVAVSAITTFTTPYLIRFSSYMSQQYESYVSAKTRYLLENYSAWVYRTLASTQSQKAYRRATTRFIINGVIVAIIFTLIEYFVYPSLRKFNFSWEIINISGCVVSLIIASPFIWAMLFAFKINTDLNKSINAFFILGISWLLTIAEINFLSTRYCHTWSIVILTLVLAIVVILLFFRHLEKTYNWFESRLVSNLSLASKQETKFQQLAPWDTHLVHLNVTSDSPLIAQSLADIQFRNQFGVNVVALQRGSKIFFAPRGDLELMPDDRLVVLGTDEQVEKIRCIVEKPIADQDIDILENVTLKSIFVDETHPSLGQTIRDSKIREQSNGIVVGLERKGIHIMNPDPTTTVLENGDLLLILMK